MPAGGSWEKMVFKARLKRSNWTSSISSLVDYNFNQQDGCKSSRNAAPLLLGSGMGWDVAGFGRWVKPQLCCGESLGGVATVENGEKGS